ncbi:MAG: gliding motility-associated C-terminal domain-containing protein [Chitinophagales bacterium]|nr:gliding motility-associated C-terminal domain-containing protein [Chitinophagales bacterium]
MKPKYILLLNLFLISLPLFIWCQPEPCDIENPAMTPTCVEACIICDIDGFTGRHESSVLGSLPFDFCTFFVHNAQWIAFQAASTDIKIRLSVSNCDLGNGLEMAIYKSIDCNTFEMVSNCRGGGNAVPEGTSAEFTNTEPLIIGQYYYLAMDGNFGDNCDWTFEVLEGSTELSPLSITAPIEGVDETCPDVLQAYTTEAEEGAVIFEWTLNGQPIGNDTSTFVELAFDEAGIYTLCVTAKNACDEATPACKTIEVFTPPPTHITDFFCEGDCYEIDGNIYCETGIYEYIIPLDNGCDSIIILDLTELEQPMNNISINICDGDTIFIGDMPYFTTGQFSETLLTDISCDSIVNLDLNVIICNMESQHATTPTICYGEANGTIAFSVGSGSPPFYYTWLHFQTGLTNNGTIVSLTEEITIEGLPVGDIVIEIYDSFGNADVIIAEILQPAPLTIEAELSDYNGYDISCNGFMDGSISLLPEGGQSPYAYEWSTGSITPYISALGAGNYSISLTDAFGCEKVQDFTLNEPDELKAEVIFTNPGCEGLETGTIEIINASGGTGFYTYSINADSFSDATSYRFLAPGNYEVEIIDDNMCLYQTSGELTAPEIPLITGATEYTTQLGYSIQLNTYLNNINTQSIQWNNATFLDCIDCLSPVAFPLQNSNPVLVVTSQDECSDSLSIQITVEKTRAFYAPNAFSPNGDGINDIFYLHGSKEVATIDLSIFDRWGGHIYEAKGMTSNDALNAWDGKYKGEILNPGLYTWLANIHFIDGYSSLYSGGVSLVK